MSTMSWDRSRMTRISAEEREYYRNSPNGLSDWVFVLTGVQDLVFGGDEAFTQICKLAHKDPNVKMALDVMSEADPDARKCIVLSHVFQSRDKEQRSRGRSRANLTKGHFSVNP